MEQTNLMTPKLMEKLDKELENLQKTVPLFLTETEQRMLYYKMQAEEKMKKAKEKGRLE